MGVGGGIGLSAAETAEGIYELATNFKEVVGALKLLADSPEFRQQFSDSYFADLEQRAELLTQAYNDAGWDGSVTAGVEGGRFAVELVGLITAVRGAAQVTAKLPSAAKTVVNAIAEAPASGSWKAQAGALGDLSKLEVPGGPKEAAKAVSPIVPGGGLAAHEAAGGHLIAKHVGQSEAQLLSRLSAEPKITGSSSFYDRTFAEKAVSQTLDMKQTEIASWLSGSANRLRLDHTLSSPVGISVARGASSAVDASSVRVILVRDSKMPTGYKILTGFPTVP